MLEALTNTALSIIGTLALAAAVWIINHFVAVPILEFYKIRRTAHEEMVVAANVAPGYTSEEKVQEAIASTGRLAARLDALRASLLLVPRVYLSFCHYNLAAASQGLRGLSNSIGMTDGSLALHRNQVQKSLKLPRDYTDQQIAEIDEARHRRA